KPDVHDTEEILNDAEESQVKMKEKQFQFNYDNMNNLYDMFVPQMELSLEQEYFADPSTSNVSSKSSKEISDSPIPKMPNESKLLKLLEKMDNAIWALRERIDKTLLKDTQRRWISDSQNELREFNKTNVIPMPVSLSKSSKELQQELTEEVHEMLNIFESMERKVDRTSKENEILQNKIDQLLEANIANDVRNLVMQSYVEIKNKKEIERFLKESKDGDKFCNDVVEVKERCYSSQKIIAQKSKDFDDVKFELSNRTAKFEAYFKKLENTKVVLERQLIRKVDDSKAEKDNFLKEINHLRAQLENLRGKSVETKFDKPLILGKPPANKLLINSQNSKSWFTPKVVVQKDLSKLVTTQSLPKNEKDRF
ncbi:hypothetical protein Tco_0734321, partial [Tanacetum coccineum]